MKIDLHPEELLERARAGEPLPASARAHLEAHLARCAPCAMEARWIEDLAPPPDAEEQALAAAAVQRLFDAPSARPASARRRFWRWPLLAAAVLAVGAVAAAAVWAGRGIEAGEGAVAGSGSGAESGAGAGSEAGSGARSAAGVGSGAEVGVGADPESAAGAETEADFGIGAVAPADVGATTTAESAGSSAAGRRRERRTAREPPPAEALFAEANQARRSGELARAVRLYRTLQRRHRGARPELVSRVTLGFVLLRRLGDPEGALPLFDSYLAAEPRGSMAEEARAGRALALSGLGRAREERRAWQILLEEHPDTLHRARAEERLEALAR